MSPAQHTFVGAQKAVIQLAFQWKNWFNWNKTELEKKVPEMKSIWKPKCSFLKEQASTLEWKDWVDRKPHSKHYFIEKCDVPSFGQLFMKFTVLGFF